MFSKLLSTKLRQHFAVPLRRAEFVVRAERIMHITRYKDICSFIRNLQKENLVVSYQLTARNGNTITLYCSDSLDLDVFTPYDVANAAFPGGYFCNLSSIYYHSLTNQIPQSVYICHETIPARQKAVRDFVRDSVLRSAFIKPSRHTNYVFDFNNHEITIVDRVKDTAYGVVDVRASGASLPKNSRVTCIERALIDAVVSPHYNGGIASVYSYFTYARGRLNIAKFVHIYKQLDFLYPYAQSIGFFLDRAGMKNYAVAIMKAFPPARVFFVDHAAKSSWSYNDKWKIYYPAGLVDEN